MKKILILIILISFTVNSQQYEITLGASIHENVKFGAGYNAGFLIHNNNMIFGKRNIFGVEYSGFMSNKHVLSFETNDVFTINDCNCIIDQNSFTNNTLKIKQYIRGVSLIFGAETIDNLFMIGSVTNYKLYTSVNAKKINEYKNTTLGGGLKYLIPINERIFSVTFKYDIESYILSIGILI